MTAPRIRPEDRARWRPLHWVRDDGETVAVFELEQWRQDILKPAHVAARLAILKALTSSIP